MTDTLRLGQQRPTRMRRIGSRHMIVMPQQQAQVLSVSDIERSLAQTRAQIQQLTQQLDRVRAFGADLEQQLAAFKALPIVRVEDDPDVPQPEHKPAVVPTGFGPVPAGATPVPAPSEPPVLTDS